MAKPKLAFYWAASCGGCEITVTELGMRLVDVGDLVDLLTLPHRNTTSVKDYRHIYRPQELKDIKVIEERSTR